MNINRREFLHRSAMAATAAATAGAAVMLRAAASVPAQSPAGAPVRRPNFLIVLADDMGFADAGCFGGEIATPTLDSLARGGIRFTQCYSTARCWPSRSCLLTGYYAQQVRADPPMAGGMPKWAPLLPARLRPLGYRTYHSGKWHVIGIDPTAGGFDHSLRAEDHDHFFNPGRLILDGQAVKPVNRTDPAQPSYLTTVIADHALDFLQEHQRLHQAAPFFLYLAFTSPHFPLQAPPQDIAKYKGRYADGWDAVRAQRLKRQRDMGIVNCDLAALEPDVWPGWNLSQDELRKRIGPGEVGRAVAWAGLDDAQKSFQARKMAVHAAMIDRMDQEVARVVAQVRAMGELDNTVILFLSDNGASGEQIIRGSGHDPGAEPGSAASYLGLGPGWSSAGNTPFRLHKSWVHEGGTSSPCIIHWPAGIAARGELRTTPCHFVDVAPTILDLAGAPAAQTPATQPPPAQPQTAQGQTAQPPAAQGQTAQPQTAQPQTAQGQTAQPQTAPADAPRPPGRSLVPAFTCDKQIPFECLFFHHIGNKAIRVGDYKLVAKGAKGPWELYDLRTDRCEAHDLAARQPQRVQELAALWEKCERDFRAQAGPPSPADPQKGKKGKAKKTKDDD